MLKNRVMPKTIGLCPKQKYYTQKKRIMPKTTGLYPKEQYYAPKQYDNAQSNSIMPTKEQGYVDKNSIMPETKVICQKT